MRKFSVGSRRLASIGRSRSPTLEVDETLLNVTVQPIMPTDAHFRRKHQQHGTFGEEHLEDWSSSLVLCLWLEHESGIHDETSHNSSRSKGRRSTGILSQLRYIR